MKHLRKRIFALGILLCLCLSLCAVPTGAVDTAEMPEEGTYGSITLSLSLIRSGASCTATYSAGTTMVDWLAKAAALCKDDERMENLRFTCTLSDALTKKLGSVSSSDYTFTSATCGGNDSFRVR